MTKVDRDQHLMRKAEGPETSQLVFVCAADYEVSSYIMKLSNENPMQRPIVPPIELIIATKS